MQTCHHYKFRSRAANRRCSNQPSILPEGKKSREERYVYHKKESKRYGYKFRCIALNDCQTVSSEYLFNYTANSNQIKDSQKGLFLMYPNPSKETINIDFLQSEGKYDIEIYTVMGIEVYIKYSIAGKWQIELRKGSYLVHVRNTQKSEIKKLIITE